MVIVWLYFYPKTIGQIMTIRISKLNCSYWRLHTLSGISLTDCLLVLHFDHIVIYISPVLWLSGDILITCYRIHWEDMKSSVSSSDRGTYIYSNQDAGFMEIRPSVLSATCLCHTTCHHFNCHVRNVAIQRASSSINSPHSIAKGWPICFTHFVNGKIKYTKKACFKWL